MTTATYKKNNFINNGKKHESKLVSEQVMFLFCTFAPIQLNENAVQIELFSSTDGMEFVDKMEDGRQTWKKRDKAFISYSLNERVNLIFPLGAN